MSYTVKKTISVPYTDHDYYISGDTVHTTEVTRHKDVDIKIHVDTLPFDNSVDDCTQHVDMLTASITGYQAAHVAAKQAAADRVVNSATNGFMNLISQTIDMQTAGQDAQVQALTGELLLQCRELSHKKEVMNGDFNRIKSRYTSLFTDLDNELRRRILALMKPCFDFVKNLRKEQDRQVSSALLSTATLGARESESARTAILASRLKEHAARLIDAAKSHVSTRIAMDSTFKHVAQPGNRRLTYYVPVLSYCITDPQGTTAQLRANPLFTQLTGQQTQTLMATLTAMPATPDVRQQVDTHFNRMVEQQVAPLPQGKRMADIMRRLYSATELITYTTPQPINPTKQ